MIAFFPMLMALMVTMVLIPPLYRYANALGVMDYPDARKVHAGGIPRVGGIAISIGAMLGVLFWAPIDRAVAGFLLGSLVLLVFGIYDDRSDLNYRLKFAGQIIAALVVSGFGGVLIERIPLFGLDSWGSSVSIPLTVLVLVGVTNAVNLVDGLDGLAGGTSLLSLGVIAALAWQSGGLQVVMISLAAIGAIFGFLRYNTHPARLFMGDTGSQFLGFVVGVVAILLTQNANAALSPAIPIFFLGLPLVDTVSVMVSRIRDGQSPFTPDKRHIHHRLLRLGFNHYEAVIVIYALQTLFLVAGYLLRYESDVLVLAAYVISGYLLIRIINELEAAGYRIRLPKAVEKLKARFKKAENRERWHAAPLAYLNFSIPAFILFSFMLAPSVQKDLGYSAAFFALVIVVVTFFTRGYRTYLMRGLVYLGATVAVYLTGVLPEGRSLYPEGTEYALFSSMTLALILALRFSGRERFSLTPTDYLIVLVVAFLGIFSESSLGEYKVLPSLVKVVILFYGCEYVLRHKDKTWNLLSISTTLAFVVLGLRVTFSGT